MATTDRWQDAVDEHRDGLEAWAASDLPLADEFQQLLEDADEKEVSSG